MNLDDAFPSKYIKASDLPEEGVLVLTIDKVAIQEIGMEKQRKPVISFEQLEKGFVCNKTNANAIAKITGSRNTDDWHGKDIRLFRAEVEFQGEMVESIRVSTKQPKGNADLSAAEGENW